MTVCNTDFSIEAYTLPDEDPAGHRQLYNQWMTAYPGADPIEQGYIQQAVLAQIELRRVRHQRVTLRTEKVRTAELFFDRRQEDQVSQGLKGFNASPHTSQVYLLRSAAGCRFAINIWERLKMRLVEDGTWYGKDKISAIQLLGESAAVDDLSHSETAYTLWLDCLAAQPNPKEADINLILDPKHMPGRIRDRDVTLWPGNPAESKARLQAIVDKELPRLKALEAVLRVQYEDPARAEAKESATTELCKGEQTLLRNERMYERSYALAVADLTKLRRSASVSRVQEGAGMREIDVTFSRPYRVVEEHENPDPRTRRPDLEALSYLERTCELRT
jgi:hypothetical protein